MTATIPDPAGLRRARKFLGVLGGGLLLASGLLGPLDGPASAVALCLALGVAVLAIARFGADRWVRWFESLLTGWP